MLGMVAQLERILAVGEALARGARVVQALTKGGNGEAAAVIQAECTRLGKQIVTASKRRSAASKRARGRTRDSRGRF